MFLKLRHCWIIWFLFASFKTIIFYFVHSIWFVKYVLFAKLWFAKTATRIVKYKSWVIKSNPGAILNQLVSKIYALAGQLSLNFFIVFMYETKQLKLYIQTSNDKFRQVWRPFWKPLWPTWMLHVNIFAKPFLFLSGKVEIYSQGLIQAAFNIGIPILGTLIWTCPNFILSKTETTIKCNPGF